MQAGPVVGSIQPILGLSAEFKGPLLLWMIRLLSLITAVTRILRRGQPRCEVCSARPGPWSRFHQLTLSLPRSESWRQVGDARRNADCSPISWCLMDGCMSPKVSFDWCYCMSAQVCALPTTITNMIPVETSYLQKNPPKRECT